MKRLMITILCLILIIIVFLITYKLIPYNQKDLNRILDIYLEKTKPNLLDYYRLDINRDGEIDVFDGALAVKKMG